jgi:hypothetical protein
MTAHVVVLIRCLAPLSHRPLSLEREGGGTGGTLREFVPLLVPGETKVFWGLAGDVVPLFVPPGTGTRRGTDP